MSCSKGLDNMAVQKQKGSFYRSVLDSHKGHNGHEVKRVIMVIKSEGSYGLVFGEARLQHGLGFLQCHGQGFETI